MHSLRKVILRYARSCNAPKLMQRHAKSCRVQYHARQGRSDTPAWSALTLLSRRFACVQAFSGGWREVFVHHMTEILCIYVSLYISFFIFLCLSFLPLSLFVLASLSLSLPLTLSFSLCHLVSFYLRVSPLSLCRSFSNLLFVLLSPTLCF